MSPRRAARATFLSIRSYEGELPMTSATGICLAAVLERSVLIAQPLRLLADFVFISITLTKPLSLQP
jgi:hypothetical protein